MPRAKNWRRSAARRSILDRSCNFQTGLTPESTPNVMQTSESIMIEGLIEASPVSVQAHPRNTQCLLTKDYKIDSQSTDHNQRNEQYQLTKDYKTSIEEKHCQIDSQNTDHNTLLYSSGSSDFPDILTKSEGPFSTEYDNGSQLFQELSFATSFEVDTTKNTCIATAVNDNILPGPCNHCFQSLTPFHSHSMICGSFHQGSDRFSVESRGSQCVSNALCALIHAQFLNTCSSTEVDQILIEGDTLYKKILFSLKATQKYTSRLLTFDEIPENVNVFKRDICIIKSDVVSGIAVQQFGTTSSPTLHQSMHTAFQSSSYVLVMIGAICSAVYKKDGLYNFLAHLSQRLRGSL